MKKSTPVYTWSFNIYVDREETVSLLVWARLPPFSTVLCWRFFWVALTRCHMWINIYYELMKKTNIFMTNIIYKGSQISLSSLEAIIPMLHSYPKHHIEWVYTKKTCPSESIIWLSSVIRSTAAFTSDWLNSVSR